MKRRSCFSTSLMPVAPQRFYPSHAQGIFGRWAMRVGHFPREIDVSYLGDSAQSPDLFICYGTGWAAVRSMLLGKIDAGDDTPVAVIAHATSPGGHYDLLLQNNLVELAP